MKALGICMTALATALPSLACASQTALQFAGDDDRVVLRQPEEPGPRVARLRSGRDRSYFQKAETERFPCGQRNGVLVHPGGETDRVGKINAENVLRCATGDLAKEKAQQ